MPSAVARPHASGKSCTRSDEDLVNVNQTCGGSIELSELVS
jgi:hypothetical protein